MSGLDVKAVLLGLLLVPLVWLLLVVWIPLGAAFSEAMR